MNALQRHKQFPFNVDVIFNLYLDVARIWGDPTPELIVDIYDDVAQTKLTELANDLHPEAIAVRGLHPWKDLSLLPSDKIKNLDELIGMRVVMTTAELTDVLNGFVMYYADAFGEPHNMPVKEVW